MSDDGGGIVGNKHTAGLAGVEDRDGCFDGGQTLRRIQASRDFTHARPSLREALRNPSRSLGEVLQLWVEADHRCVHIDDWVHDHPSEVAAIFAALRTIAEGKQFVLKGTDGQFSVTERNGVTWVEIPELRDA